MKAWAVVTKRGRIQDMEITGSVFIYRSKSDTSVLPQENVVPVEIRILGKKKRRGKS